MNTGFRPIPLTTPFRERCRIMVARGEAKSFSEASKLARAPRRSSIPPPSSKPTVMRLPYADA